MSDKSLRQSIRAWDHMDEEEQADHLRLLWRHSRISGPQLRAGALDSHGPANLVARELWGWRIGVDWDLVIQEKWLSPTTLYVLAEYRVTGYYEGHRKRIEEELILDVREDFEALVSTL